MEVKQIQYRADATTAACLKQVAAERGTSVNALIDQGVQRVLDEVATAAFERWAASGGAEQTAQLWRDQQAVLDADTSGGGLRAP
jgi:hypothetical protein